MDLPTKGSHVLVPEDGMVHLVSKTSGGAKTDGSYDFYAYRVECQDLRDDPFHVAFDGEAPRPTDAPLTCLACVAAGPHGDRR